MGEPAEVRQKRQGDHMDDPRVCGFRLCFQHSPEWGYIRFDKQKLPQTGVLWWPVPILAVTGFAFLITGTFSRKKKDDE